MSVKLLLEKKLGYEAQNVKDASGQESALALSNNYVCIGHETFPKARLHIVDCPRDSNGNTLILGDTSSSNLRLGYHEEYSWIQSHGLKPLYINELGNDVIFNKAAGNIGVGVLEPTSKLEVDGDVKAKGLILDEVDEQNDAGVFKQLTIDEEGKIRAFASENSLLEERIKKLEATVELLAEQLEKQSMDNK